MDLCLAEPQLSPFVVVLLGHFCMIISVTSSLSIIDDSSQVSNQTSFWNYIGTSSKLPCVPLTIRNCKEIRIKRKYLYFFNYLSNGLLYSASRPRSRIYFISY